MLLGPLPQRHLQHPRPERQPAHQRPPGPHVRVGQGHQSVQSRRARAVTLGLAGIGCVSVFELGPSRRYLSGGGRKDTTAMIATALPSIFLRHGAARWGIQRGHAIRSAGFFFFFFARLHGVGMTLAGGFRASGMDFLRDFDVYIGCQWTTLTSAVLAMETGNRLTREGRKAVRC